MSYSMSTVVQKAHQRFQFLRNTREERVKENQRQNCRPTDFPPVFNKRLFTAKSNSIIITREARKILTNNFKCMELNACRRLTDNEIRHMSYLVEVLSLIHHNLQYVKECLCYVVTYETHDSRRYVEKLNREECLSCFYIVSGRVEVTYDRISLDASVHVHERNLIYTHGPGEYLGLVSHEGEHSDLEPPSTMYTLELCEFIRIDRQRFHDTMEGLHLKHTKEKKCFLDRHQFLKKLPAVDKARLIPGLVKQVYPANKIIVRQGQIADSIHFVSSGRCQFFRKLYLKQTGRNELFKLGYIEEGDVFGGESVINGQISSVTVTSAGIVTCYRINRMHFKMTARENLVRLILRQPKSSVDDDEIRSRGSNWTIWQNFRRARVVELLKDSQHSHLLKNNVWLRKRPVQQRRPQTCQPGRRGPRRTSPQRSKSVPATFRPTNELPVIDSPSLSVVVERIQPSKSDFVNPNWHTPILDFVDEKFKIIDFEMTGDALFSASNEKRESDEFREEWLRLSRLISLDNSGIDKTKRTEEKPVVFEAPEKNETKDVVKNIGYKDSEELETDSRFYDAIYEAYERSKEDISISKFRMNCLRKILRGRENKRNQEKSRKHKNYSVSGETVNDIPTDQISTIDELREKYDNL